MVKTHGYHKYFTSNTMSDSVICVLLYRFPYCFGTWVELWFVVVVDIGLESFGTQVHEPWVNLIFHTPGEYCTWIERSQFITLTSATLHVS